MNDAAAARALAQAWAGLNGSLFRGAMQPPVLAMSDAERRLGVWQRATRTIRMSRRLVLEQSWPAVVDVLKHEMAHQYVDEVLKVHDEQPHGQAFRRVCHDIGIDDRASGAPDGEAPVPAAVAKVRKLLALADSPNQHEAEAAARAAHRWMRRHNIEHLDAPPHYATRTIGRTAQRHMAHEKLLAGLLGKHFFVHPVWVAAWRPDKDAWGKVLEVSGRPENLAMAAHVWDFVLQTGEAILARRPSRGRGRGRFLSGLVMGFGEQLDGQADACEEQGLVWVGDAALDDFVGARYPRLRAGRGVSVRGDGAWKRGREAGKKLVLNKPMEQRPSGVPRRLPSG